MIKDNRKIDSEGRPKDGAKEQVPPGGVGQPGTPVADQTGPATPGTATPGTANPGTTAAGQPGAAAAGAAKDGQATAKDTQGAKGQDAKDAQDAQGAKAAGESKGGQEAKDAQAAKTGAEAAKDPTKVEAKGLGAELEALRSELDERLRDLQRVSAEYANYRKRVERDRNLVAEQAVGAVLSSLLPILDDVDRAREHGDLNGPFAAVAEQLTNALAKFGLNAFGEKGDPFDPTRHEAVTHETSPDVTEPTCVSVMRRGYLLGDRLLRPAMVAVADPE